jgi:hypothetical protein
MCMRSIKSIPTYRDVMVELGEFKGGWEMDLL